MDYDLIHAKQKLVNAKNIEPFPAVATESIIIVKKTHINIEYYISKYERNGLDLLLSINDH